MVVVLSIPPHPPSEDMPADPITLNSKLVAFTQFGNILDLCYVPTPATTYELEDGTSLPSSVTFFGASYTDAGVLRIAARFQEAFI